MTGLTLRQGSKDGYRQTQGRQDASGGLDIHRIRRLGICRDDTDPEIGAAALEVFHIGQIESQGTNSNQEDPYCDEPRSQVTFLETRLYLKTILALHHVPTVDSAKKSERVP